MNQILFTKESSPKAFPVEFYSSSRSHKKKKIYLYVFILLNSIIIGIFFYILYRQHQQNREANITDQLKSSYQIATLYEEASQNYDAIQLSSNLSIIGLVEIPKINISYPILASSSEEALKISVCRFAGPLPNHIGNLCIAGHNYKNTLMFSKLDKLSLGDSVYISDIHNNRVQYSVYDKYTIKEDDLSCTSSSNKVEVTLVTCNASNNSKRLVIKAKMKE